MKINPLLNSSKFASFDFFGRERGQWNQLETQLLMKEKTELHHGKFINQGNQDTRSGCLGQQTLVTLWTLILWFTFRVYFLLYFYGEFRMNGELVMSYFSVLTQKIKSFTTEICSLFDI